jgi:hypothetical protein
MIRRWRTIDGALVEVAGEIRGDAVDGRETGDVVLLEHHSAAAPSTTSTGGPAATVERVRSRPG